PVPGTLMIEPTESESKGELDRFCEAMIAIWREIADIENGRWKVETSRLRQAPHTVHDIADDTWARPYSRAEGCFPAGSSRIDKYWSPVGRVDNVYGDRNLVCSCPPVTEYAEAAEEASKKFVCRLCGEQRRTMVHIALHRRPGTRETTHSSAAASSPSVSRSG